MSLLPLIQHSRRKAFISPLAGTMIATQQFQSTPKSKVSTISYSSSSSTPISSQIRSNKTQHKLKQSYIDQQPKTSRKKIESSGKKLSMYHTLDADRVSQSKNLITPRQVPKQHISSSHFTFPNVEIIPLYLINSHEQIKPKTLVLNLQQYFKLFFNAKISHRSEELNHILLKYLPLLKEHAMLDVQIVKQKWPSEFWEAQNTLDLLNLIGPYRRKSSYWTKYILVLICLYCMPDKQVRDTCLDNLILTINKQLSARLKTNIYSQSLVLMKEDGTNIEDLIQIAFDTKKLYIAKKEVGSQQYQAFLNMQKQYELQCKKRGFMGRLRSHFRRELVPNRFDEESINYRADYSNLRKQRDSSLKKAMRLLQLKKQKSNNNISALSCQIPPPISRPKSKEAIWKEQNIEDLSLSSAITYEAYYFRVNLNNKRIQQQIKRNFKTYNKMSKQIDNNVSQQEVLLGILQRNHPTLKALGENRFHSEKLRKILEIITDSVLPEDHLGVTLTWNNFVELEILSSKDIRTIIDQPDCYQIYKNFAENYLEMRQEDYFRGQLSDKLCRTLETDKESLTLMEDVIWSWLTQNGFIRHQAIQREVLWSYPARSKTFYMLIVSMAMGTFKTTPLDLAYQLLM